MLLMIPPLIVAHPERAKEGKREGQEHEEWSKSSADC
jgi:hypothetical protein